MSQISKIPFNRPFIIGSELDYITEAVQSGRLAGNGIFTKKCHTWMEQHFGAKKVFLTHSCTAALEMAAILADIQPGDEVIMPSYTFVSTANAFVLRGGVPIWCDIREDTLNIDEAKIESLITHRTKAIIPVHYAGVACEMDTIMEIAHSRNLMVVEDAAQGVNAKYKNRYLGTIGHLGCYSFHETKNFISGEGGALLVNDANLMERAEIIWEKGTNRSQFFRGQVDKYTWIDIGSSFLPSELIAAFLYAQLEQAVEISRRRLSLWQRYDDGLEDLKVIDRLKLPVQSSDSDHNAHLYYLIVPSPTERDLLMQKLQKENILSVFHYVPLHLSPMGRRIQPRVPELPVTESIAPRVLRLPLFYSLKNEEIIRVIAAVRTHFNF